MMNGAKLPDQPTEAIKIALVGVMLASGTIIEFRTEKFDLRQGRVVRCALTPTHHFAPGGEGCKDGKRDRARTEGRHSRHGWL